jgi:hypothetical protein
MDSRRLNTSLLSFDGPLMRELDILQTAVIEAADRTWFIQAVEDRSRSDNTLSMRFIIRPGLFVQVFFGEKSASLYMALIEGRQRIFGVDREGDAWHVHPFHAIEKHEPLTDDFSHRPVSQFLAKVEEMILAHDLL